MVRATNMSVDAVKSKEAGIARISGFGFILSCFAFAWRATGDIGASLGPFLAASRLRFHFLKP